MNFERNILGFIDALTAIDAFCIILTYAIYALLVINVWSNFKFIKFAKHFHIIIFSFVLLTGFCLYFCGEKPFITLFSNVFVDIVFISSVLIYAVYFFHRTFVRHSEQQLVFDKNDKNKQDSYSRGALDVNNDCENNHKTYACAPRASGTYNDYYYYYSDNDKYAEPFTTPVKDNDINKNNAVENFNVDKNDSSKAFDNKNYKKNEQTVINDDVIVNTNVDFIKKDIKTDELDQLISKAINKQNNFKKGKQVLEEKQELDSVCNEIQHETKGNEISRINLKQNKNTKVNSNIDSTVQTTNSVKESEEKILSKMETALKNNNTNLERKFGLIETDIENLRNSIQGIVDRITKLFELLAITMQENKKAEY